MKRVILLFQIIVLLSQSVRADDTHGAIVPTPTIKTETAVVPEMPKGYRLPDMQLLDSVRFYNRYRNQKRDIVDVEGISGRFGASWGDEFKKKIFNIERQADTHVEIILTLSSTMEDAKLLKQRMAMVGRKMVIVELPDHIQEYILKKADAEAVGGIRELWWDTKDKVGKLINIRETISNSKKIIRNQFVAPTKSDIGLVWVSVSATAATTALLLTVGNIDPALALSLGALRAIIGATTTAFHRTLTNLFKSDIFNELNVTSRERRVFTRLSVMGWGLGEFYRFVGMSIAGVGYGVTPQQLFTNTYSAGLIESMASEERKNRLSDKVNHQLTIAHIIIGAAISSASIVGATGPLIYDHGIIQISSLLAGTVALYTSFFFAYRYFAHHVEKVAQRNFIEISQEKWRRLRNMREAKIKRISSPSSMCIGYFNS